MNIDNFSSQLAAADNFVLRRAIERLRDGLFDPFAVHLLTARESLLNKVFVRGEQSLSDNNPTHLCVCGSYGQGKSHSLTYFRELALERGFVTSQINLDPREIPFHDFQQVYQALISGISFPDNDDTLAQCWKKWAGTHQTAKETGLQPPDIIPDSMPHFFKTVLTALARKNIRLSQKQKGLKKHSGFRPSEFPWLLAGALQGEVLPVFRLRKALKYRQVAFHNNSSLVCRGWEPYFQATCSLAEMFQKMGYKGWVLLFDEGESIAQRAVNMRRKSYSILDRFFSPATPLPGLFPIFAFTDDFFMRVQGEDYDRLDRRHGQEAPYFEKNYAKAWQHLHRHNLHDLAAKDWQDLTTKLIHLHARAYNWQPPQNVMAGKMVEVMAATEGQEARYKIKAFVDQLDLSQQKIVLA